MTSLEGELVVPPRLRAGTNPGEIGIFVALLPRHLGAPGLGLLPSRDFSTAFFRQIALALTLQLRGPRLASQGPSVRPSGHQIDTIDSAILGAGVSRCGIGSVTKNRRQTFASHRAQRSERPRLALSVAIPVFAYI